MKEQLKVFLKEKLNIELSMDKTKITNGSNKAKFLGYDISINNKEKLLKIVVKGTSTTKRVASGTVNLLVPKDAIKNKLLSLRVLEIKKSTNQEVWNSKHRAELINLDDLEILEIYNAEIRGLYNYYKLANNVSGKMNSFYHIMEYSLYKTLANKYKASVKKICKKHNNNQEKTFRIEYINSKGNTMYRYLYNKGFCKDLDAKNYKVDVQPNTWIFANMNGISKRLSQGICEWCGKETKDIEMHHINKLKNLKGKKRWEILMISRKRKTLPLCVECHDKLHAGKLD